MTNLHCVIAAKKGQARIESVGNGCIGQSQGAPECPALWHLDLGMIQQRSGQNCVRLENKHWMGWFAMEYILTGDLTGYLGELVSFCFRFSKAPSIIKAG